MTIVVYKSKKNNIRKQMTIVTDKQKYNLKISKNQDPLYTLVVFPNF